MEKTIKFLNWEVNLTKVDDNKFCLIFTCKDKNKEIRTKDIKINDTHKDSNIGLICKELFDKNHLKWTIEVGENSSLYDCDQPDLMLQSQLNKTKKIKI